jgi:hypothetical protein
MNAAVVAQGLNVIRHLVYYFDLTCVQIIFVVNRPVDRLLERQVNQDGTELLLPTPLAGKMMGGMPTSTTRLTLQIFVKSAIP